MTFLEKCRIITITQQQKAMPKFKETDDFIVDLRQQTQPQKQSEPVRQEPIFRVIRKKKEERSLDELIIEAGRQEVGEEEPRRFFVSEDLKTKSWLNFVK